MSKRHKHKPLPGRDGKFELAGATVENPYAKGESEEVLKNISGYEADRLYSRGPDRGGIDHAQYEADRIYRQAWEALQGGSQGVVDPSNEPVDTSGRRGGFTDRQLIAGDRMRQADALLGEIDAKIMRAISGRGETIRQVAQWYMGCEEPGKISIGYISSRWRDALGVLAREWGLAGP